MKYEVIVQNLVDERPEWRVIKEYEFAREAAFEAIERNRRIGRIGSCVRANTYAVRTPGGRIIDPEYEYGQEYSESLQ